MRLTGNQAGRWLMTSGLGWLLLGAAAQAQTLRLDEALRMAVSQHPSVTMRLRQRDAAAEALEGARWGRFPAISGQTARDAYGKDYLTLRIEQPLWTGGRLSAEIAGAEATLRGAFAVITESQQDIMLRAASAYTELGRFEAGQLAARANVLEHERLHRMILQRIENQITPTSDGLLAGARLSQARAELNQIQAQAARTRARLAEIIGQTVGDIEPQPARQRRPASLAEASRAAVAFSPVLRRLAAQQDSAEADIQVKRGQALPQVKLRHERNLGGSQPANQTYLMLEYQSGAGLASLSAIRQSEARRQALEAERQSALRDLSDEVSASWADLQAFEAQTLELRTQVAATVLVFESFTRQYAIGRKNWIEVLNAQRELTQARQALADAEWSGLRSALKLQLATGKLSADRPPATTLD